MPQAIRYIGPRPEYTDFLYGSGLKFTDGQVRTVPDELARKFLRQEDIFQSASEAAPVEHLPAKKENDDTESSLRAKQKEKDDLNQKEFERSDLVNQILVMEKEELAALAKSRWNQVIDKRASLDTARNRVIQMVDQYGAA